jgi:hypothetical protein
MAPHPSVRPSPVDLPEPNAREVARVVAHWLNRSPGRDLDDALRTWLAYHGAHGRGYMWDRDEPDGGVFDRWFDACWTVAFGHESRS